MNTNNQSSPDCTSIFIVGCGRSGSTLLQRLLSQHDDVAPVGELLFLDMLDRACSLPRTDRRVLGDILWHRALMGRSLGIDVLRLRALLYETLTNGAAPMSGTIHLLRALEEDFEFDHDLASRPRVVLHKTLNLGLRAREVAEGLPSARLIHVVRDGRAVARSHVRLGWYPTYRSALRNWVERVRLTEDQLSAVEADRVLRIRFEDLVQEPLPTLRTVSAKFGIPVVDKETEGIDRAAVVMPLPASSEAHSLLFSAVSANNALSPSSGALSISAWRVGRRMGYEGWPDLCETALDIRGRRRWAQDRQQRQTRTWMTYCDDARHGQVVTHPETSAPLSTPDPRRPGAAMNDQAEAALGE